MKKHDAYLRTDFFETPHIHDLREETDGAELTVTYIFLGFYTDEDGFIRDDDLAEIAADFDLEENELRDRLDRLVECELADLGMSGYWLTPQEEL